MMYSSSIHPFSSSHPSLSGLVHKAWFFLLMVSFFFKASPLIALPYNFHTTQGDIEYQELITEHFRIYFDKRVSEEGLLMGQALEGVKPLMELWLGKKRGKDRPLKVVSSPVTWHASFANFIYDAIELQTVGQNIRDLAWHEYSHILTYEHYRNILSPPGSIFHILWMPAWFLEGVAEALSVSVGSDYQSGVERWHALSGEWPSYDRLHSLYLNAYWSARGYATSGAFVSWLIREMNLKFPTKKRSLPGMLEYFRKQTMPWMLPFNLFMPMNRTLSKFLQQDGQELYEIYKKQARAYWKLASPRPLMSASKAARLKFSAGLYDISTLDSDFSLVLPSGNHTTPIPLTFDHQGWAVGYGTPSSSSVKGKALLGTEVHSTEFKADIVAQDKHAHTQRKWVRVKWKNGGKAKVIYKGYNVVHLFEGLRYLGWMERSLEHGLRLCQVSKKKLKRAFSQRTQKHRLSPECLDLGKGVFSSQVIGSRKQVRLGGRSLLTTEIWTRVEESTLSGDRYRILVWDDRTGKLRKRPWHPLAKPIKVAFAGKSTWVLTSDRTLTYLLRVTETSLCLEALHFSDFILDLWGSSKGELLLKYFEGFETSLMKINPRKLKKYNCPVPEPHSSPLLEGMRILMAKQLSSKRALLASQDMPTLEEVIQRTHSWKIRHFGESVARSLEREEKKAKTSKKKPSYSSHYSAQNINDFYRHYRALTPKVLTAKERHRALLKTPNLLGKHPLTLKVPSSKKDIKDYSFRWSSPVLFPWLGPNDSLMEVGVITIPLVDDLQNHTLRGTVLVGLTSQYPAVQLNYTNTRFHVPWEVSLFKRLTYNGYLKDHGTYYFDETGAFLRVSDSEPLLSQLHLGYVLGFQTSYLDPYKLESYKGTHKEPSGLRNQPFISLSLTQKLPLRSSLTLASTFVAAPGFLNEDRFDYLKTRYEATLTHLLFNYSTLRLSTKYGQTRGRRTLIFKELYSSMSSYIPGSGAPANKFERPLMGSGNLFRLSFGDTYLRNTAALRTPLFSDLDTQIWIFYAERLDWNLVTHYGKAWSSSKGESLQKSGPFLWAYATTIDLHLENKGVQFYLGLGIGKLHNTPYDVYNSYDAFASFGFQAFF